jgi:hypothetical protein
MRGVGNSYVVNATLELYRHPFPDLVDQVRKSLKMLKVSLYLFLSYECWTDRRDRSRRRRRFWRDR